MVTKRAADHTDNFCRQGLIKFLTTEGFAAKNISDGLHFVYGESSLGYASV